MICDVKKATKQELIDAGFKEGAPDTFFKDLCLVKFRKDHRCVVVYEKGVRKETKYYG